jgi:hypothetical protein
VVRRSGVPVVRQPGLPSGGGEAGDAEHGTGSKPSLFGQQFEPNPGTRFGLPPFYALHAWVWKPNPTPLTGIFAAWNPRVTC